MTERNLVKLAAKNRLIVKLSMALGNKVPPIKLHASHTSNKVPPIKFHASHTSNPTRSLTKLPRPTAGIQAAMLKAQGATDNLQRYSQRRNSPPGPAFKPPSSTNLGIKTGPLSLGASFSGGKPSAFKVGWGGKINNNLSGNIATRFPIGGGKPYFSAGLQGRF